MPTITPLSTTVLDLSAASRRFEALHPSSPAPTPTNTPTVGDANVNLAAVPVIVPAGHLTDNPTIIPLTSALRFTFREHSETHGWDRFLTVCQYSPDTSTWHDSYHFALVAATSLATSNFPPFRLPSREHPAIPVTYAAVSSLTEQLFVGSPLPFREVIDQSEKYWRNYNGETPMTGWYRTNIIRSFPSAIREMSVPDNTVTPADIAGAARLSDLPTTPLTNYAATFGEEWLARQVAASAIPDHVPY